MANFGFWQFQRLSVNLIETLSMQFQNFLDEHIWRCTAANWKEDYREAQMWLGQIVKDNKKGRRKGVPGEWPLKAPKAKKKSDDHYNINIKCLAEA